MRFHCNLIDGREYVRIANMAILVVRTLAGYCSNVKNSLCFCFIAYKYNSL